jgi:hypothetical protein
MRTRHNGDHDGRVTMGYLFSCLQPTEPILRTRVSPGAVLSQNAGAGARGSPKAAPSREAGAGAVVLTQSLYAGVPGPQGTDTPDSSGCETRRRRLSTCYSCPAADWIRVTIMDRDRFGSCRSPPPALCSASIGSVLLYTGSARQSFLHRLGGFHSARSHGDTRSPQSCPVPGGGC